MNRSMKQIKMKQPEVLMAKFPASKKNLVYPEVIPSISERGSTLQNYLARISKNSSFIQRRGVQIDCGLL